MGRASIRENKSVYQLIREGLGLTREEAADVLDGMTANRIEKIENGRVQVRPEDVLILARGYKAPALLNHYCANECPIGRKSVSQVTLTNLPQIVLQMLALLNAIQNEEKLLIDITNDGEIQDEEIPDFVRIQKELDELGMTVDALKLWSEQMLAEGRINISLYEQYKKGTESSE